LSLIPDYCKGRGCEKNDPNTINSIHSVVSLNHRRTQQALRMMCRNLEPLIVNKDCPDVDHTQAVTLN
jgi:hypothetical protein